MKTTYLVRHHYIQYLMEAKCPACMTGRIQSKAGYKITVEVCTYCGTIFRHPLIKVLTPRHDRLRVVIQRVPERERCLYKRNQ